MEGVLQVAALLVGLGTATVPGAASDPIASTNGVAAIGNGAAATGVPVAHDAAQALPRPPAMRIPVDSWTGEDKFRHAAASWAALVFTYAGARAVHDDSDAAIAVAVPVTAALGVAKEVVDHRRGGPFSFRDLAADALGAGAAWLFVREMR